MSMRTLSGLHLQTCEGQSQLADTNESKPHHTRARSPKGIQRKVAKLTASAILNPSSHTR